MRGSHLLDRDKRVRLKFAAPLVQRHIAVPGDGLDPQRRAVAAGIVHPPQIAAQEREGQVLARLIGHGEPAPVRADRRLRGIVVGLVARFTDSPHGRYTSPMQLSRTTRDTVLIWIGFGLMLLAGLLHAWKS